MQFVLTRDISEAATVVRAKIVSELEAGQKVLWILSGGSQIEANQVIMDEIPEEVSGNLTITLADERYGSVGHPESNFAKLMSAGFNAKRAKLIPVLMDGLSLEQTRAHFDSDLKEAFERSDYYVGQLGIGPDGHTAGILPFSAATKEVEQYAVAYESDPYTRITISFFGLRKLSIAYALCFGEEKRQALNNLSSSRQIDLSEQPAQILKQIAESYVYNDLLGR